MKSAISALLVAEANRLKKWHGAQSHDRDSRRSAFAHAIIRTDVSTSSSEASFPAEFSEPCGRDPKGGQPNEIYRQ